MKITFLYIASAVCVLLATAPAFTASSAGSVTEGNRLYNQGKFEEAAEKYRQAKEESSGSDIASFNLGAALFKKGDYQEAIDSFTQSLHTESRQIEADATYNIANAKYKLGSGLINSDLNGAASLYREALDYYKRAIELNESNTDAKYNHEFVEKELKVLLDKIKNQPPQDQQQDKKDENQEQEQEQEQKQDQQQSSEKDGGDEQQEKTESENGQDEKEQPADNGQEQKAVQEQAGQQESGSDKTPGQYEQEPQKMSPEEARMLLDAFADEEAMENVKKMERGYNREVLKDW